MWRPNKTLNDLQIALSGKEVPKVGEYSETAEHEQSSIENLQFEEDEYKPSASTEDLK